MAESPPLIPACHSWTNRRFGRQVPPAAKAEYRKTYSHQARAPRRGRMMVEARVLRPPRDYRHPIAQMELIVVTPCHSRRVAFQLKGDGSYSGHLDPASIHQYTTVPLHSQSPVDCAGYIHKSTAHC